MDVSTPEKVIAAFDDRIEAIEFKSAAEDVRPYLNDASELKVWSKELFHQLVRKLVFAD